MEKPRNVRVRRGLVVNDRGQLGRECPLCGDIFYRDVNDYTDHWALEHAEPDGLSTLR
jgi:uncharacterized C2H2 Zn-finger protein